MLLALFGKSSSHWLMFIGYFQARLRRLLVLLWEEEEDLEIHDSISLRIVWKERNPLAFNDRTITVQGLQNS